MRFTSYVKVLTLITLYLSSLSLFAQNVNFTIDSSKGRKNISPLVYGYNAYADGSQRNGWDKHGGKAQLQSLNLGSRRLGGNVLTSYNWENGISNSGEDWCHSSNQYLSTISGAGNPNMSKGLAYYEPGAALIQFHNQSLELGTYSLLQLPAAGKLPRDMVILNPPGSCKGSALWQSTAGPSNLDSGRWVSIVNDKPAHMGPLSLQPNVNDGVVYIDEEINFLLQKYQAAATATGVKAYELDNEPDLWHHAQVPGGDAGTHANLYPQLSTVNDVLSRNQALASTIKRMDSSAETYGPALSGYLGLYSLWSVWDGQKNSLPSDWSNFAIEPYLTNRTGDRYRYNGMTMANVYLASMKTASQQAGRRLLDVFSFHYYPQASSNANNRVQAPRSLWDPTYVEPSWITQSGYGYTDGRGLQLIPKLQQAIQDFYPDTKLAITEYDFGGKNEISGAIAQADALGIMGQQGVYFATYFGAVENFIASAFKIYRNVDGKGLRFPDVSVSATSSNQSYASVFAAVDPKNSSKIHIIAINRGNSALNANIKINHPSSLKSAQVFGIVGNNERILPRPGVSVIRYNQFSYSLPASSVLHFVVSQI